MDSCNNCSNRVFDERFGEYVCGVYCHQVKDVDKYLDCKKHKTKA